MLLATGIVDRLLPIRGIAKGTADAVMRICAICDGYEASDHRIAVYGPAATMVEHAGFLRTYSFRVSAVLSESAELTLAHRELADSFAVTVFPPPSRIELIHGTNYRISGCRVQWSDRTGIFDSFYPVSGSAAQSELATALDARVHEDSALVVDTHMQTSVDGLYAIDDVVSALNPISVAVGHAVLAVSAIHERCPPNALKAGSDRWWHRT